MKKFKQFKISRGEMQKLIGGTFQLDPIKHCIATCTGDCVVRNEDTPLGDFSVCRAWCEDYCENGA